MSIGSISYLALVNKSLESELSLYARVLAKDDISAAPLLFPYSPIAGTCVILSLWTSNMGRTQVTQDVSPAEFIQQ